MLWITNWPATSVVRVWHHLQAVCNERHMEYDKIATNDGESETLTNLKYFSILSELSVQTNENFSFRKTS